MINVTVEVNKDSPKRAVVKTNYADHKKVYYVAPGNKEMFFVEDKKAVEVSAE